MDIDILLALQEFKNGAGACLVDFMTKLSFIGEMKTVLIILIQKKVKKEKSLNVITDELESDEVEIRPL